MGRSRAACALFLALWALTLGILPYAPAHAQAPGTLMIDWPGDGAAVPSSVTMSGWAVAQNDGTGTGIDGVRAYLDGPADVGLSLGPGNYGLTRSDVALALREGRYAPSGWQLQASLPPGPHALFVYAHQADRADDDGWLGPVQVMVRVDGGSVMAALPTSERVGAPVSANAACTGRDASAGACSAGSAAPNGCAVPDRDSGRCLVRAASTTSGGSNNGGATTSRGPVALVPGSWTAADPAAGPGPNGGPATSASQARLGYPAAPLLPAPTLTPASDRPAADTTTSAPSASTSTSGAASPAAARPSSPSLSLAASPMGTHQFQLTWNTLGPNVTASYEVRRCSSLVSAPSTCEVVATVQAGAYRLVQPEGFYYVRALGPQGQAAGESNRLQLCCRS